MENTELENTAPAPEKKTARKPRAPKAPKEPVALLPTPPDCLRLVCWNVNGVRAVMKKGFPELFSRLDADFVCLQETKLSPGVEPPVFDGYYAYWNLAEKKGYSGTAIITRHKPYDVTMGLGIPELDTEGRVITLEMDEFFLVCVYTPNSGGFLARLPFRKRWDAAFRRYVSDLDKQKPVIICGDFNAVHKEIDARNFEDYAGGACFTDQERGDFSRLLEAGFTDTFRYLYPDREHAYSWWSYMQRSRQRDEGWRIDCFLVSNRLVPRIAEATILKDVTGSDHCPIELFLRKS